MLNTEPMEDTTYWTNLQAPASSPTLRPMQTPTPDFDYKRCLCTEDQKSGFAWVIAHNDRSLWKGVSLAPGTADDMYSGRAEAFGLLAALLFLAHYVKSFDPQDFQESPINCFCDNIGVITRTTKKISTTIAQPNDMTADDSEVYMALGHTI